MTKWSIPKHASYLNRHIFIPTQKINTKFFKSWFKFLRKLLLKFDRFSLSRNKDTVVWSKVYENRQTPLSWEKRCNNFYTNDQIVSVVNFNEEHQERAHKANIFQWDINIYHVNIEDDPKKSKPLNRWKTNVLFLWRMKSKSFFLF